MSVFAPLKKILPWTMMSLCIAQISLAEAKDEQPIDKQLLCMAKNIYYEAGLESYDGKVAVAQVTINRTKDGKFPKTVCGVVNQKTKVIAVKENKPVTKTVCQFSWVCNPPAPIRYVSDRWEESVFIATEVMYNGLRLPAEKMADALYFHNTTVRPNWGLERVAKIGNHIFYNNNQAPRKIKSNT